MTQFKYRIFDTISGSHRETEIFLCAFPKPQSPFEQDEHTPCFDYLFTCLSSPLLSNFIKDKNSAWFLLNHWQPAQSLEIQ